MSTPPVTGIEVYFDQDGRLTHAGQQLMQEIVKAIQENKIAVADHETRLVALEP